jgi:hypothetical protein
MEIMDMKMLISIQINLAEPEFVNLLRSPGIDSQHGGPLRQLTLFDVPAYQAT